MDRHSWLKEALGLIAVTRFRGLEGSGIDPGGTIRSPPQNNTRDASFLLKDMSTVDDAEDDENDEDNDGMGPSPARMRNRHVMLLGIRMGSENINQLILRPKSLNHLGLYHFHTEAFLRRVDVQSREASGRW